MKSYYLAAALACGATLSLTSCEKVLDKVNLGAASADLIYNDSTLANLTLSYVYDQNLPGWGGTWGLRGDLSDESFGDNDFLRGLLQQSAVTDFGTALNATNNYGKIRTINMFIRDVRAGTLPQGTKNRLVGQAQFFRAWRYFDLVRLYGGVPLVFSPQAGVGVDARNAAYLPRNSSSQTFAAIRADLDSAITTLPGKWPAAADWGHVTKGAAAALKGRALLYAASPQFSADNPDKWKAAYDASLQAKTLLLANGYGLHGSYDQMWFQEANNPEAVFLTSFNPATGDQTRKNNGYDNSTRPAYTGTSGGSNLPTWDLAKAYPMLDGKKTNETGTYTYSDQFFYRNRDPRFAKTIAYNGTTWPLNGNTNFKLWTYLRGSASVEPGSKPTQTGLYLRKAISPTAAVSDVQYSGTDWIEIRYAEVLLNLAEGACGIGDLSAAYDQLKLIRNRAGIPAGGNGLYGLKAAMTREEMFDAILFERQIELAFEGKRFWDLRRWRKIESTLNGKRRLGVIITLNANAPSDFANTRDNLTTDQAYAFFTVTPTKVLDTPASYPTGIAWKPAYYFFGIPQSAIDNNPSLIQNKDWNAGQGFDPTL